MPKKIIYAEDAIEALTEIESHFVFEDGHGHLLRWAKNTITALPSAHPLDPCETCLHKGKGWDEDPCDGCTGAESKYEPDNGWIPCSERLPDITEHHTSDPCIVFCDNGAYGFAELEENIFGQVGWDCERDDEYHEPLGTVVAWMPLPEPYQSEM